MKILIVSNCYPPFFVGGYELGCRDVVESLRKRGHEIEILTSSYGSGHGKFSDEPGVHRKLNLAIPQLGFPPGPNRRILGDCAEFVRVAFRFKPDICYFWSQTGLCHWLVPLAQVLRIRTAFFLSDTSFPSWSIGALLLRWVGPGMRRSFLSRIVQGLSKNSPLLTGFPVAAGKPCHFASAFLRRHAVEAGVRFDARLSRVIHWGVSQEQFIADYRKPEISAPTHLLYAGQLIREKGVHTAIQALANLVSNHPSLDWHLTIVGGSTQPDYESELHALVDRLRLSGRVRFLGKQPRERMPEIYGEHHVLVFPSIWEEPFAITPLEAMRSGLCIVGTLTGGSGEILQNRVTGLTFEPNNSDDCAEAIERLLSEPSLRETLQINGRAAVASSFSLDRMVDQIEQSLHDVSSAGRSSALSHYRGPGF